MLVIHSTDLNAFIEQIVNSNIPHPVYFKQASGTFLRGRSTFPTYNPPKYGLAHIPLLVQRLYFLSGSEKALENSTIRYVIDNDKSHTPYFSSEGSEKGDVSAHERLSAECLAAGMLRFKECNGDIVLAGIDHDSGYFKPAVDCLIWPLKMLLSTSVFHLSTTLQLYCRNQGAVTCFTLDTNTLLKRVNRLEPRVSSFFRQQSASDSYEMLRRQIQQQEEAAVPVQQNDFLGGPQLPYDGIEAMSMSESSESIGPPVKRSRLATRQTERQSSDLMRQIELKYSLEKIGFSKSSAFTIWQSEQSHHVAASMMPSPSP